MGWCSAGSVVGWDLAGVLAFLRVWRSGGLWLRFGFGTRRAAMLRFSSFSFGLWRRRHGEWHGLLAFARPRVKWSLRRCLRHVCAWNHSLSRSAFDHFLPCFDFVLPGNLAQAHPIRRQSFMQFRHRAASSIGIVEKWSHRSRTSQWMFDIARK